MEKKAGMKKCIFHIPYKLDLNGNAAPMLRPKKMIEGFKENGYDVDVIEGIARERKEKIKKVIEKIRNGVHYDFLYAESSTMPTLLTESHHLPTHPLMDFSFFYFCQKKGIKIGLFYRDIYWKFDSYRQSLPRWKSFLAIQCYKKEIRQYEKLLDKLYLPSYKIYKYLHSKKFDNIVDTLPPGCDNFEPVSIKTQICVRKLHIFYVGGLGHQYQIDELMNAVKKESKCELIICCREKEWEKEKMKLKKYMSTNIHIVHKNSNELEEYYKWADICALLFKPDVYMEMAMPYKAFEYLGHGKPALVSSGTAIGEFVRENDLGWSMEYHSEAIRDVLNKILEEPDLLLSKTDNCIKVRQNHTWNKRAEKVVKALTQ